MLREDRTSQNEDKLIKQVIGNHKSEKPNSNSISGLLRNS
jgi:hypothetical protein